MKFDIKMWILQCSSKHPGVFSEISRKNLSGTSSLQMEYGSYMYYSVCFVEPYFWFIQFFNQPRGDWPAFTAMLCDRYHITILALFSFFLAYLFLFLNTLLSIWYASFASPSVFRFRHRITHPLLKKHPRYLNDCTFLFFCSHFFQQLISI